MIECDVVMSHEYLRSDQLTGKTAVVIDTLRATSVMVSALSAGAREILCVSEPDEARRLRQAQPDLLLGGERDSLKIPGFDLSNSPLDYTRDNVGGRTLVMTTTNGTRTLLKAAAAETVLIGCLLNARAAMERALALSRDIVLVNAGTGGRLSLDDLITAGAMLFWAKGRATMSDAAQAALLLYEAHPDLRSALTNCRHVKRLLSLGLTADLDYCLTMDALDIVPSMEAGRVRLDAGYGTHRIKDTH